MKLSEKYFNRICDWARKNDDYQCLIDEMKIYGNICNLEGEMYQVAMSKGREIDITEEKMLEMEWIRLDKILHKIAIENNLLENV